MSTPSSSSSQSITPRFQPDKDDLCDYLNNLYGFDGIERSWL